MHYPLVYAILLESHATRVQVRVEFTECEYIIRINIIFIQYVAPERCSDELGTPPDTQLIEYEEERYFVFNQQLLNASNVTPQVWSL